MVMEKDLDKIIKTTEKELSKLDKLMYEIVLNYFIDSLTIGDGGKITLTDSNAGVISAINEKTKYKSKSLFQAFKDFVLENILKYIGNGISRMQQYDVRAVEIGVPVIDEIKKHAATVLDKDVTLERIYLDIKDNAISLISRQGGVSLQDLKKQLFELTKNNKLAKRYYGRWVYDIYSQYERIASNKVRIDLGLKYAIYQGGLIDDSRTFCKDRNDKVFTEDEIKSWISLDFAGKSKIGYDPLIDLGGYSCRHRLDWISELLAFRLRPDLKPKGKK